MTDGGDVKFSVDLARGIVAIKVRPPLGLEGSAVSVDFDLLNFLDVAARMTLQINEHQRKLMRELATMRPQ